MLRSFRAVLQRRGFTLVEVAIAVAIVAALTGAVAVVVSQNANDAASDITDVDTRAGEAQAAADAARAILPSGGGSEPQAPAPALTISADNSPDYFTVNGTGYQLALHGQSPVSDWMDPYVVAVLDLSPGEFGMTRRWVTTQEAAEFIDYQVNQMTWTQVTYENGSVGLVPPIGGPVTQVIVRWDGDPFQGGSVLPVLP